MGDAALAADSIAGDKGVTYAAHEDAAVRLYLVVSAHLIGSPDKRLVDLIAADLGPLGVQQGDGVLIRCV